MKLPLQIVFHGMEPSPALEAAATEKAHKLGQFAADIMSCRVDIDELHKHQQQGRPFGVAVHLKLPGHELTVDRVRNEDAYVALRDAFDDMKRQLEDTVRQRRGKEKLHPVPLHGEVVRLFADEAYGFIRTPDGNEYYFGRDNLADTAFDKLEIGARVQFIAEAAAQGMQAKRVSLGKHAFG